MVVGPSPLRPLRPLRRPFFLVRRPSVVSLSSLRRSVLVLVVVVFPSALSSRSFVRLRRLFVAGSFPPFLFARHSQPLGYRPRLWSFDQQRIAPRFASLLLLACDSVRFAVQGSPCCSHPILSILAPSLPFLSFLPSRSLSLPDLSFGRCNLGLQISSHSTIDFREQRKILSQVLGKQAAN